MRKIIFLSLTAALILGGFFYYSSISFQLAAAKTQPPSFIDNQLNIENLKTKVGQGLLYSVDRLTQKVSFIKNQGSVLSLNSSLEQKNAEAVADQFLLEYGEFFGLTDPANELSLIKTQNDELGMTHVRYNQKYNNVPVFGGQIIVHLNKDLSVASANGRVVPNISLNVQSKLSREEAVAKAQELCKNQFQLEAEKVLKSDLYVFNKGLVENKADDKNYLVWQIELIQEKPALHEFYYLNAQDGSLILQITGMQSAIHRHIWDCSGGLIDGWGDCWMDYDFPFPYDIFDYYYGRSEGQPARGANPNPYIGTTDTDDLYDITGYIHSYYESKFSRNGANNLGGIGDGSSTFPSESTSGLTYIDYHYLDENDYLSCPNAFFNSANSIHFCQGYVSKDITGHEYAHAVNYFSILNVSGAPAGLTYQGESGALNENNSDVFGEATEYYINGSNDWLIGEDLADGASRSMSDPASYNYNLGEGSTPYPDRFNSENFYCGANDGGGVHINSSVPNHAAYLMAIGGTFNNCTITGIGRDKEEAIFYRAQTVYYTTSTGFNDAYSALITSCGDLYGAGSTDCLQVEKALRATEMNQGGTCSGETAQGSGCAVLDAVPTISNVSSNKANGRYKAGTVIDIDVTFSKAVTSSGNVTVTLETGKTDRTCAFTATNTTTGSCNYTVKSGDKSSDLNVKSISGSITDLYGQAMSDFGIATNLSTNKGIIIDTIKPVTTISPTAGLVETGTKIKLAASETATIYYTKNGNKPTTKSAHYSKSIAINEDTIFKYFAVDRAGNTESYKTTEYTVIKPASIITAPGPGGGPQIRSFNQDGEAEATPSNLFAFATSFRGGVHVATCDVDADGVDEIITGVGPGDVPYVKVFEKNGTLVSDFLAYSTNIQGGVFVACGDLDGNGRSEVITGVPEGFGPHLRVFDGRTGQPTITMGFFAYGQNVRTGIRVAAGDLDGNGKDEIVVGAGSGAGSQVRTFNGTGQTVFTPGFFVYGQSDRTGIKVATGDVDGDGKAEIITGSGVGRAPEVKVYNRFGSLISNFSPYSATYLLGVKVSAGDVDGDGEDEIVTGTEAGGGPQVKIFKSDGTALGDFFAYSSSFRGGVDVAVGEF